MQPTHRSDRNRRGAAILWLLVVVAGLAVGGFLWWGRRDEAVDTELALSTIVAREKLRVSVVEAGQLKAAKSVDIYCKVKGGATILELVEEGKRVEAGDVVVKLDASNLEDDLTAQKIKFQNAKAAFIQAEKAREIQESKNDSDTQKATVDLALAHTDLRKYLEGDFPLKEKQAASDKTLAESEEKAAKQKADDTAELVALDYAAETELQSDRLAFERASVKKAMSELQQQILADFEKPRQVQILESDVQQKGAELERVKLRCEADLAQKVADFESKKATFELEQNKLAELEAQLNNTTIRAPSAGLVVYPMNQSGGMGGRGGSDRDRIEEGATARENQLLISLPDTSEMIVSVSVHESAVDKVKVGQPAIVTIDAVADQSYIGRVTFIAPLPDSANQWLNPDLKVYRCEITVGGASTGLRPGMSASAEIVVDELKDAIALPIHAVYRRGDRYYVYVADATGKPLVREVKIGLHNDARVAISEGLEPGEKVYLSVPPGAPQPDFPETTKVAATSSVEELRAQASAIPSRSTSGRPDGAAPAADAGAGAPGGAPGAAIGGVDFSKLRGLSEEERKKALQEMLDKMTPEQKAAWEEQMKRFGGGAGGAPGGGRGPRGERGAGSGGEKPQGGS